MMSRALGTSAVYMNKHPVNPSSGELSGPDGPSHSIEAISVSKSFGPSSSPLLRAVDDVSLAIGPNEFFTLLGPSGCGKTTLLRLIAGFEEPTTGDIRLFGESLRGQPPYRRRINTVFQHYALFPNITVERNVAFGLEMLGKSPSELKKRVAEMLSLVKMEAFAQRYPSNLSGGQQQRVALARALAPNPKILLLDEPLSALDLKLRQAMRLELKMLQAQTGITFIFVTHDQEEALTMSDRIAVMSKGSVQQVAGPEEIYKRPANRFVAEFIGDNNLIPGRIAATAGGTMRIELSGIGGIVVDGTGGEVGDAVTLAIRPELLSFTAPSASRGSTALSGCVFARFFLGTDTAYHVELLNKQRIVVRDMAQNRAAEPSVGDPVTVHVVSSAPTVFKN